MGKNIYSKTRFTRRRKLVSVAIVLSLTILTVSIITLNRPTTMSGNEMSQSQVVNTDSEHKEIIATEFWVGESESSDNDQIHNRSSAWLEDWEGSYGGVDDPENRCGYLPCGFTPKENPFYFALPYNDLDENGQRKESATRIPGYNLNASSSETQLRNRWIKVTVGDKTAYAQWADVGPFGEEDFDYVYGTARPQEKRAGLDLSPAMADFLAIDGRATASWKFVDESEVPAGEWTKIITR